MPAAASAAVMGDVLADFTLLHRSLVALRRDVAGAAERLFVAAATRVDGALLEDLAEAAAGVPTRVTGCATCGPGVAGAERVALVEVCERRDAFDEVTCDRSSGRRHWSSALTRWARCCRPKRSRERCPRESQPRRGHLRSPVPE